MTLLFGHTDAFPIKDNHQIFQDDQLSASRYRTEFLIDIDNSYLSETDRLICAPRPTSYANTQRVQSVSKRQKNIGRENYAIIKNGKIINRNTALFYLLNFNLFPSGLLDPDNFLISLGKLII